MRCCFETVGARLVLASLLILHIGHSLFADLIANVRVNGSPPVWSYTLSNNEPTNSPNFISSFILTVNAPITTVGTPPGWDFVTDNSTYVYWFNTDVSLPYPHDIAPGTSLAGFSFSSTAPSSQPLSADVSAWDHIADGPGPTVINPVLAPSTAPALSISKTHVGNFFLGQTNATYSVLVSNANGATTTSGAVTVTDTVPSGLMLVSMAGTGWTCMSNTCARTDPLLGGASYSIITVTVNVASNATSPQVNQVSVSGGGSLSATANDSTIVGGTNQPTLSLSQKSLNYGFSASLITDTQSVTVSFTGGSGVNWTASSNQANITVSPTSGTGNGTFQVTATSGPSGVITVTALGAANSPQQIQVRVSSASPALPYGSFDTPVNNTTGIAGAIPVTGWALDNVEVTSVGVYREPLGNESPQSNELVYVGTATFVAGARPDVQATYPNAPLNYRGGWGYMLLTNELPNHGGAAGLGNGTYKLHAIATNKSGMTVDLGTRAITVSNAQASKPFGTIDTPDQGGTTSGNAFVNFGWALTQHAYAIPTDGSTITVILDGVPVGHPTYNQFRSDIANLFPGLANSNGAVGFFFIDTTTLANGVHTISWNVFDNAGRGDGIGSRYFTVQNTGTVAAPAEPVAASTDDPATARVGFRQPDALPRASDGTYLVDMEELDRVELRVGASEGQLLVAGERRSLPIGSTLKGGVFYWQPGPGFLGEYELVFERPDAASVRVRVVIRPKSYGGRDVRR